MVFGKSFPYRCYTNPDPKKNVTLLVLAGGSGPADGFFYLCDNLMPEYNLLSFDYPQAFPDNASLAGETLLFFSKEDTIFTESMKQNLVDLMTDPRSCGISRTATSP